MRRLLYQGGGKKRSRRFVLLLYSPIETVFDPLHKPSTPTIIMESHLETHFDSRVRE